MLSPAGGLLSGFGGSGITGATLGLRERAKWKTIKTKTAVKMIKIRYRRARNMTADEDQNRTREREKERRGEEKRGGDWDRSRNHETMQEVNPLGHVLCFNLMILGWKQDERSINWS